MYKRQSTVSVNNRIGDKPDDEVNEDLRFVNIHYFAAGSTLFGTEVKGAYEFAGQEYTGRNGHVPIYDSCTECHGIHDLEIVVEDCGDCHEVDLTAVSYTHLDVYKRQSRRSYPIS